MTICRYQRYGHSHQMLQVHGLRGVYGSEGQRAARHLLVGKAFDSREEGLMDDTKAPLGIPLSIVSSILRGHLLIITIFMYHFIVTHTK